MLAVKRFVVAIAVIVVVARWFPLIANAQASDPAEEAKVVETVQAIFTAARADDLVRFHAVTSPGFYLYDEGARFDGDAIMHLMKAAHDAGQVYDWNVTEPDVHITGNTAWIAYVNKGSLTSEGKTRQLQWLESAFLEKQNGVWKIAFMHSTRVPEAKQN